MIDLGSKPIKNFLRRSLILLFLMLVAIGFLMNLSHSRETKTPITTLVITETTTVAINSTTITYTKTVYPETTVIQTTILVPVSSENTTSTNTTLVSTLIENITTVFFKELPTYTYTEYKFVSVTTTRPPELYERATWIGAGVFVGILAGLTIGYAYYAKGVSIKPSRKK